MPDKPNLSEQWSRDESAPVRLTPTQRLHEVTLAALTRTPVKAHETVEVSRDVKGYRYSVAGVVGEEEDLEACAARVMDIVFSLDAGLTFVEPESEIEVSRNAKGDTQWSVKGGEADVARLVTDLSEAYPLSRKQNFDRDYLPGEK